MTEFWTWFLVASGTGLSLFGLAYMYMFAPDVSSRRVDRARKDYRIIGYYGMFIAVIGQMMALYPTVLQLV